MKKEITYEENEWGRYKVIKQSNGVSIKLHRETSDAYKQKMARIAEQMRIKNEAIAEKERKENLIKQRMRDKVLDELKDEGLLPGDYK